METWQVILVFGVLAIVFDGIWATIAKAKGYTYSKGMWVSFLIYVIAGVMGSQNGSFMDGIISGAGVAIIEATIGWWVSSVIGPGRLPDTVSKEARPKAIMNAIVIVTLTGALFGLLGALVNWLITITRA
ncbi:MAG: hypothetical protein HY868_22790 [Chloroflexi bacterium]|nr:hypothetical protein [Chloroflexota bacterium]